MRSFVARHRGRLLAGGVLVVALAAAGYVVGLNASADYAIMLVQKYTWQETKIESVPRLFAECYSFAAAVSGPLWRHTDRSEGTNRWPNQPGTIHITKPCRTVFDMPCPDHEPLLDLTLMVQPEYVHVGWNVTYVYDEPASKLKHSWLYAVSITGQVHLVREWGEPLDDGCSN